MDLRLRARAQNDITVLEVGGEIDLHSAPRLRAELVRLGETAAPRLVVDLREVSFVDSTGIGVLVGALKRARERGGSVHFCAYQPRVRRVFEITGLMNALPLFNTRDEAIAAFQESPSHDAPVPHPEPETDAAPEPEPDAMTQTQAKTNPLKTSSSQFGAGETF